MVKKSQQDEREALRRDLDERATEKKRQWSGSTPTEDVLERAFESEPGVERHAGEDPGGVPDPGPNGREEE